MKQQGLAYFTDLHLTSIGLLIFFIVFVAVFVHAFSKKQAEIYKELEKLPYLDGDAP
ncbi:MAG: cbb3-type cytochrome c oxidase subunit 3 [Pseudobdellovibrionaceae bacterium]|jgi:cbb3-type cytochrome oxidase subunit 3